MEKGINFFSVLFKSILLFCVSFTYGADYRGPLYNTMFIATAFITTLMTFDFFVQKKFNRSSIYTFFVIFFPIILNIIVTLQIDMVDRTRHYNFIIITSVILFSSYILITYFLRNVYEIKYIFLMTSFIWGILNVSILILNKIGLISTYTNSFSGIFNNRNDFAISSVILLALVVLCLNYYQNKNEKKLAYFSLTLLFLLILLSLSMKGLFGSLFVLVIYKLVLSKNNFRSKVIFINLGLACLLLIGALGSMLDLELFNRIELYINSFLGNVDDFQNSNERISLLQQAVLVARDNFFTGIGMDNSRYYLNVTYASGRIVGKYSHNNYLEYILNGGIFTFISYYFPIIYIYIYSLIKFSKKYLYQVIFILITLKLFFDSASVTYTNASCVFIYVFCILVFLRYNKRGDFKF